MLYACVTNIVIYLIIAGIANNVVPGKEYKKYVSFFNGLIILLIILEPVSSLRNKKLSDLSKYYDYFEYICDEQSNELADLQEQYYLFSNIDNRDNDKSENDKNQNDNEQAIYQEILAEISQIELIQDKNGMNLSCIVYVSCDLSKEKEKILKKNISKVYNIEFGNIYISKR